MMDRVVLKAGAHASMEQGGCAMEFAAWVAGEKHTDEPHCVSPVIGAFVRPWNDALDDVTRQRLVPFLLDCIGTNTGRADDVTRSWLATDWLVRVQAPAWLDLAKRPEAAAQLRGLPPLTSSEIATASLATIRAARDEAAAAWDAAWAAVGAAAGVAAGVAAGAAAGAAAGVAAGAALRPTVVALQESAFDLLGRMIAVGRKAEPIIAARAALVAACVV